MNKPRLLVTRFAPHGQRLTALLKKHGVAAFAQPLLQVQQTTEFANADRVFTKKYDRIIAVSHNAVDYTDKALANTDWPKCQYFAVGKGTQTKLKNATGQEVIIPEKFFTSEGLLALPQLADLNNKK